MSTFKAFFKEEITEIEPIKIKLARFKQEIEVKPLSPEKQEELIDSSQKTRINSKGKMEKYVSQGKYEHWRTVLSRRDYGCGTACFRRA